VALVAFQLARHAGASESTAYLIGSTGPLLSALRRGRGRENSVARRWPLLAFTLLSAVAAVVSSHNPDLLLYKDAMATGLIGVIFAGSLLFPRPLAFYFGQRYATDGTHVGIEAWRRMWQYRAFRQAQYAVTTAWAVVYLIEAAALAYVIHSNGFTAAYTTTQVLPCTATGVAVALTIALARHYRRAV
jgi:hypothetical protein